MRNAWDYGYRDRYDEPWFCALDYETRQRYMAQDQARLEMHNRVLDGSATDYEFAELCREQARENLAGRQKTKPEARMTQAQVNEAMGVSATEMAARHDLSCRCWLCQTTHHPKYEDPEELRRGRVALGLEEELPDVPGEPFTLSGER